MLTIIVQGIFCYKNQNLFYSPRICNFSLGIYLPCTIRKKDSALNPNCTCSTFTKCNCWPWRHTHPAPACDIITVEHYACAFCLENFRNAPKNRLRIRLFLRIIFANYFFKYLLQGWKFTKNVYCSLSNYFKKFFFNQFANISINN